MLPLYILLSWTLQCLTFSSSLAVEICGFPPCVDTAAQPISTFNHHISQFHTVCDNSACNHIHIHTYTFSSLFKHWPIFSVPRTHLRSHAHTRMQSYVWTGPLSAIGIGLVINSINYLRNFRVCKHWQKGTRWETEQGYLLQKGTW